MDFLTTLESKVIWWTRMIALIALVGLLLLAFITVFEVLIRWLFHMPMPGVSDVSTLVITVSIAACFPLVFAQKGNITVRMAGSILGPRIYVALEAFGYLVGIGIYCLLTWQLWIYTTNIGIAGETTTIVQLSLAPWYRIATVMFILCIPVQVLVFLNQLVQAITGRINPQ